MLSRITLALVVALVPLAACKDKDKAAEGCSVSSVGTCHKESVACGIRATCKGKQVELKCTPPPDGAKTIECTCNENSVVGKKVEVEFTSADSPFSGDTSQIVKTACGY